MTMLNKMELIAAPLSQAMEREVDTGKARGGPAFDGPKPLVQSQKEAVAFGQRFWAQYLKDSEGKPPDGEIYFKPQKMYSLMRQGGDRRCRAALRHGPSRYMPDDRSLP
jgi:hypothetical protein